MNLSVEALLILLFLAPGFLASLIFNAVTSRKEKDAFSKVTESLIFSLIIYGSVAVVSGNLPVRIQVNQNVEAKAQFYSVAFDRRLLIYVIIASVILPLVLGWLRNRDYLMRPLRSARITDRTARETTWLDVFTEQQRYVIVTLTDGRRIFGWPMYYSTDPAEGTLYLYKPAWIDNDNRYVDIPGHGLFLVKKESIEHILFTETDKNNAVENKKGEADGN